jgi:hypothetical protein
MSTFNLVYVRGRFLLTSPDVGQRKADERRFLLTFVSIIVLAVLFAAVAHAWPEIMPWHRPNARHIP